MVKALTGDVLQSYLPVKTAATDIIDSKTLLKIRKLELSSNERAELLKLSKDVLFNPVIELLGGVLIAEYGKRQGWFGTGFNAWAESQGLELALAGIIAIQVMNSNPEAVKAVGGGASALLSVLTKGLV